MMLAERSAADGDGCVTDVRLIENRFTVNTRETYHINTAESYPPSASSTSPR